MAGCGEQHRRGAVCSSRAEDGVFIDEQDGDDVKLLGIYSTKEKAEERIVRARLLPGFRDEPKCFTIVPYLLNDDTWEDGFVRLPHGE
ncbi:DUF7336 domain-containing protein [Streptomyces sp. NPDC002540]